MTAADILSGLRVGVDLDNTVVCYSAIFRELAASLDMLPPEAGQDRIAIREHFRRCGREREWTELQGQAYGPHMALAVPYPGVREFFRACRRHNVAVFVISHRTRFPYGGPPYDLHAAAYEWLDRYGFFDRTTVGLPRENTFLEATPAAKLARLVELGCTAFVDDLPEFLDSTYFPTQTERILFDPDGRHLTHQAWQRAVSWQEVERYMLQSRKAPT